MLQTYINRLCMYVYNTSFCHTYLNISKIGILFPTHTTDLFTFHTVLQ